MAVLLTTSWVSAVNASEPNVLLILADDLGYSDLQDPDIRTPVLDRLARTGVRFSNFYAQPSCGPSRAALMTGSNPARVGMNFDPLPGSAFGLERGEFTLGEMFKTAGYRTGYFGKWHIGDKPEYSPLKHGFDRYFGITVSSDMWPFHARAPFQKGTIPDQRLVEAKKRVAITGGENLDDPLPSPDFFPPLQLFDQASVVETNPDQSLLSVRFTTEAQRFIGQPADAPFFAMVAYTAPHVPLHAHHDFKGKSRKGLYGDVVEELDFRIGQLFGTLEANSKNGNTLVIFLSDNGPWLNHGIDAGTASPFQGGKSTVWEGGWRVPAIFNWPGTWPARQVDAIVSLVDVLPTLADSISLPLPSSYHRDGKSFKRLLSGQSDTTEGTFLYFADFSGSGATSPVSQQLQAIRHRSWKLHLRTHRSKRLGWLLGWRLSPVALYDLGKDPGELSDVQQQHPDVVRELLDLADSKLNELCESMAPWAHNSCE